MTELIACLCPDGNMWKHVSTLVSGQDWESAILIGDERSKQSFACDKSFDFLAVDFTKPAPELIEDIRKGLKEKVKGLEVAVNIVSGNGKQHTAIMSALFKLGVGIRLVAVTAEGIQEL